MAAFRTIRLILDNAAFSELVNSVVVVAVAVAVAATAAAAAATAVVLADNNLWTGRSHDIGSI